MEMNDSSFVIYPWPVLSHEHPECFWLDKNEINLRIFVNAHIEVLAPGSVEIGNVSESFARYSSSIIQSVCAAVKES